MAKIHFRPNSGLQHAAEQALAENLPSVSAPSGWYNDRYLPAICISPSVEKKTGKAFPKWNIPI